MKTKHLLLIGIILLAVAGTIFSSCRKQPSSISTNVPKNYISVGTQSYETVNFTKNNSKTTIASYNSKRHIKYTEDSALSMRQVSTQLSQNDMSSLLANLKSNFPGDLNNISITPSMVAIYATGSLQNISLDKIQGISIFVPMLAQGYSQQHFYKISNNTSTEDTRFTANTTHFIIYDLFLLATTFSSDNNLGMAFILNPGTTPLSATYFNQFGISVLNNSNFVPRVHEKNGGGGGNPCEECGGGTGNQYCCTDWLGENYMCRDNEWEVVLENTVTAFNATLPTGQTPLDTFNLAADINFEHNFLAKYTKGQQYIKFYFQLCTVIGTAITIDNSSTWPNLSNLAALDSLGVNAEKCARILQFGNDNDIPISTIMRDQAIRVINSYKSVSTNPEYQSILTQIENDMITFAGQTRAQVISAIQ